MSDKYDKLEKAQRLLEQGVITEAEFQSEKAKILEGDAPTSSLPDDQPPALKQKYWNMEENAFCMLIHLSQFAGFIVPVAGFVLPIVMWATEKDKSQKIDAHGKHLLNFFISFTIYLIVSFILSYACIGIPLLFALLILGIVFPIIAAVKANEGIIWKYPLSIPFFSVSPPHN